MVLKTRSNMTHNISDTMFVGDMHIVIPLPKTNNTEMVLTLLNKCTKNKQQRLDLLLSLKSIVIYKRILKTKGVSDVVRRNVCQLIKPQVRFLGRKWRSGNMWMISLVYLECRMGLYDVWCIPNGKESGTNDDRNECAMKEIVTYWHKKTFAINNESDKNGLEDLDFKLLETICDAEREFELEFERLINE